MPEPDANSIAGSNALTAARGSRCFDDCVRPREAVLKRSRRGPTDRLARRKTRSYEPLAGGTCVRAARAPCGCQSVRTGYTVGGRNLRPRRAGSLGLEDKGGIRYEH